VSFDFVLEIDFMLLEEDDYLTTLTIKLTKRGVIVTNTQTRLPIVKSPDKKASILAPTVHPVFNGSEQEDLLCGNCDVVLAEGVSASTIMARFAAPVQLLVKCPVCSSHNRLPAQVGH